MAYLHLDKDLGFDEDWQHEMKAVSKGQADMNYVDKLGQEAQKTALYVQDHGVVMSKTCCSSSKLISILYFLMAAARRSSIV